MHAGIALHGDAQALGIGRIHRGGKKFQVAVLKHRAYVGRAGRSVLHLLCGRRRHGEAERLQHVGRRAQLRHEMRDMIEKQVPRRRHLLRCGVHGANITAVIERSYHDMGGLPAGKVEPTEHDYPEWERRVDAMVQLLRGAGQISVDELRKNIEGLPPEAYDKLSYYEKWISSLTQTLLQRGVISTEELGRKMEEVAGRKK